MNTIFSNALWVSPLFWTLVLLAVAVVMFVRNKVRMDAVALLVMLAFYLSGILDVNEIFAGFSDPNIVLIGLLFIMGEGLVRTGVAYQVSDWILKAAGNSETKVLVLLMLAVAGLGSVMSSIGVVAIFIPVVMMICRQMNISPKRLMMPLSVSGLISGMMTLIATAPNLVVNAELIKDTHARLKFFDFTPIGLVILLLGIGYMWLTRRWLDGAPTAENADTTGQRSMAELIDEYGLRNRAKRFVVRTGSPFIGKNLNDLHLRSSYGLNVLAIERWKHFRPEYTMPLGTSEIREKDILMIDIGRQDFDLDEFCRAYNLEPAEIKSQSFDEQAKSIGMAELTLVPGSVCIGKTTAEIEFRSRYGLNVVGIKRDGQLLPDSFTGTPFKLGDLMLVVGDWKQIQQMRNRTKDFVVLTLPREMDRVAPAQSQAPHALFSVAVMVVLMVSGLVPNVIAALIGCLMLGYFRCVDAKSAYDALHWPSLILIVGMMPFATALQKTGGIQLAVETMSQLVGNWGMHSVLMVLFIFCAIVGLFISNTATAILVAPIAISLAKQLHVSPIPFAMVVAIAASAAFMTPVSSPVNTMVVGPADYKFSDFLKIGAPFTLIVMLVTVFLVPLLFPF